MYEIIDINFFSQAQYEYFFTLMSDEKKQRVNRFRFENDKKRTVFGEMLARKMISSACGIKEEKIVFGVKENGKPFAKNAAIQFNISHSADFVACAVSDTPVGIDIEKIDKNRELPIDFVCGKNEREYILGADSESEIRKRFFEIWTKKEAYSKFTGEGISSLKKVNTLEKDFRARCETFFKDGYAVSIYK